MVFISFWFKYSTVSILVLVDAALRHSDVNFILFQNDPISGFLWYRLQSSKDSLNSLRWDSILI